MALLNRRLATRIYCLLQLFLVFLSYLLQLYLAIQKRVFAIFSCFVQCFTPYGIIVKQAYSSLGNYSLFSNNRRIELFAKASTSISRGRKKLLQNISCSPYHCDHRR